MHRTHLIIALLYDRYVNFIVCLYVVLSISINSTTLLVPQGGH